MNATRGAVLLSLITAAILGGCCKPMPTEMVSLETLLSEYNANAAPVDRLWARAKINISVPVGAGLEYEAWGSADANGYLLLFKGENRVGPQDFVLIGNELDMNVFRTGVSTEDGAYYYWQNFGTDAVLLWGHNELAGAPGVEALPIDPLQLLAVLGICELPTDHSGPPSVALSMNTRSCEYAYVVTCIDRQPVTNKLLFRREIHFTWEDGQPRRPFRVDFFDARGLRVMHAELKDYKPIELADAPEDMPQPIMPTDITITWEGYRREGDVLSEDRSASVHLVLSEMVVNEEKGDPIVCKLWDRLPPKIQRRIQVDRNVAGGKDNE